MVRKFTALCLTFLCTFSLTAGTAVGSASSTPEPAAKPNWPPNQELPTFKSPKKLDVADVYDAPGDIKLLFGTLQGIVNRSEPRIYLIENQEEGRFAWLNDLDVPYKVHDDYWNIFAAYKQEVKGIIVYDPQVRKIQQPNGSVYMAV